MVYIARRTLPNAYSFDRRDVTRAPCLMNDATSTRAPLPHLRFMRLRAYNGIALHGEVC